MKKSIQLIITTIAATLACASLPALSANKATAEPQLTFLFCLMLNSSCDDSTNSALCTKTKKPLPLKNIQDQNKSKCEGSPTNGTYSYGPPGFKSRIFTGCTYYYKPAEGPIMVQCFYGPSE